MLPAATAKEIRERKAAILDDVLNGINIARAELGMAPLAAIPKGKRGTGEGCPIFHALEVAVLVNQTMVFIPATYDTPCIQIVAAWYTAFHEASMSYALYGQEQVCMLRMPLSLRTFVSAFDLGLLPEYIEENNAKNQARPN